MWWNTSKGQHHISTMNIRDGYAKDGQSAASKRTRTRRPEKDMTHTTKDFTLPVIQVYYVE